MARFLVRRLAHALLVLWLVTSATFVLLHTAPGGPAVLADPKLTAVERRAIEHDLGLDRSVARQYLAWHGALLRGDLGRSFLYQTPALATIAARMPNTVLLAGLALGLAALIALPLGGWLARRPGSPVDRVVTGINFTALAVPPFWIGIVAILVFAARARILPAGGMTTPGGTGQSLDLARHLVLPVLVLALPITAELIRYARSSVATALGASHLTPARARGITRSETFRRHVLRNALLPILTVVGLQVPLLVGGAAVTETVFAWPGMGRLGVEAALGRDYPLVMAMTLVVAVAVVLVNLLIDLLYVWVDPRVRVR